MSQETLMISILDKRLKITHLTLHLHLPKANLWVNAKKCNHTPAQIPFTNKTVSNGATSIWPITQICYTNQTNCLISTQLITMESNSFDIWFNTLGPGQNGWYFVNNIFKCIFLKENLYILIQFVPPESTVNKLALVQAITWYRPGNKSSELIITQWTR